MRLTPEQKQTILQAGNELAGEGAGVRRFGLRVDGTQRGGDIDLLVEPPAATNDNADLEVRMAARISHRLDGRKVDVLVVTPNTHCQPIHEIALQTGVELT